jgi:L-ascorbate metabolism protein UlaG (beta-lactamase superfamily)
MLRSGLRRYPAQLAGSFADPPHPRHGDASREPDDRFTDPAPVAAVWLGHATVLLRLAGRWILTDPVFSRRIGPRIGRRTYGVSRHAPAPIDPTNLPHIDLVLLSHAHFDHLDRPSLDRLASEHTTVVTAPKTGDLIPEGFGAVHEIGPGEHWKAHGLRITACEPDHWGSRFALDRWRGCNAYLARVRRGAVFFAGDTALTRNFEPVGPVDLSIFGIGAYDPWEHAHATPEQAWRMAADMRSGRLLPMHHSTFELSDEPAGEPLDRLLAAAGEDDETIVALEPGELWTP